MSGSVLPFGVVPNSISWFQCLAILKPDVFYTSNKIKPALHLSPRVDPPKDRWDRHDTGPGVDFPKGKTLLLCVCVFFFHDTRTFAYLCPKQLRGHVSRVGKLGMDPKSALRNTIKKISIESMPDKTLSLHMGTPVWRENMGRQSEGNGSSSL